MRFEGTLAKWNNDRGFGLIAPTQGGPEIFAHITAFPRDGKRPRLGESLTFETGTDKNGKKQAINILCPTRSSERPYRLSEPARRPNKPGLLGRVIPLVLLIALATFGYSEYTRRVSPQTAEATPSSDIAAPTSFHCDGRTYCTQMTSCAEAEYFLQNCPNVEMDGNRDGEPCEQQWCN